MSKTLNIFAKRIADFKSYADHREIKGMVVNAAKERGCAAGDIKFDGIEYPEEIDWQS